VHLRGEGELRGEGGTRARAITATSRGYWGGGDRQAHSSTRKRKGNNADGKATRKEDTARQKPYEKNTAQGERKMRAEFTTVAG